MPAEDTRQLIAAFLLVVGALLPIVNPLGSAPMSLAMTLGSNGSTRALLALKVAISSFLLLLGSMVFGTVVLRLFAFIVLCIGVQITWNGVRTLMGEVQARSSPSDARYPPSTGMQIPLTWSEAAEAR